jgi:hypothetical protein
MRRSVDHALGAAEAASTARTSATASSGCSNTSTAGSARHATRAERAPDRAAHRLLRGERDCCLHLDIIRFREVITVSDQWGNSKPALEWLPKSGRATLIKDPAATKDFCVLPALALVADATMETGSKQFKHRAHGRPHWPQRVTPQ